MPQPAPRRHRRLPGRPGARRRRARPRSSPRRTARPGAYDVRVVVAATPSRSPPRAARDPSRRRPRRAARPVDTLVVAGGAGHRAAPQPTTRLDRWIAARPRALAARRLGLHRRVPARRAPACSTAAARRRTGPCCDALAAALPAVDGRPRPDLRRATATSDLGRRHRRHGPRARARRGGPRPRASRSTSRASSCSSSAAPAASRSSAPQLAAQRAEREPLRELQAWIADNLAADLSVPALAARAHMSPRHFARAFKRRDRA